MNLLTLRSYIAPYYATATSNLGEWLPDVRYLEAKMHVERRSAQDFVRCPESGSVRFSEVANIQVAKIILSK